MAQDRYYTLKQVSEMLQVSEKTLRRLIKTNRLQASRIGNQLRIAKSDLQAYIETTKEKYPPTHDDVGK